MKKWYLFILLLIPILFFYEKDDEMLVPEEKTLLKYLASFNNHILDVSNTLATIESLNEADEAVYKLTEILTAIEEASRLVEWRPVSSREYDEYIERIIKIEDEIRQNENCKNFINEYKKIHQKNYCGSLSLNYLLNHYFLIKTESGYLFPLHYSTRYRLLSNLLNDGRPLSRKIIQEYHSPYHKKHRLPLSNDLTLIMLDAFSRSGYRGFHIDNNMLSPIFPTLRGENALFENCLCSKYCFTDNIRFQQGTATFSRITDISPQGICLLKKTEARALPGFLKEKQTASATYLIFSLPTSFKSPFLIVLYNADELYPHAFDIRYNLEEYD